MIHHRIGRVRLLPRFNERIIILTGWGLHDACHRYYWDCCGRQWYFLIAFDPARVVAVP